MSTTQFPHYAIPIRGLHGYAQPWVVAPEDTISFCISNSEDVSLDIYAAKEPAPSKLTTSPVSLKANVQNVYPGSYICAPKTFDNYTTGGLTFEIWVRPWANIREQWNVLLSQNAWCDDEEKEKLGIVLFLTGSLVGCYLGDGTRYDTARLFLHQKPVPQKVWSHIAVVWDATAKTVSFYVTPITSAELSAPTTLSATAVKSVIGADTYLRFCAGGKVDPKTNLETTDYMLNADIAMPAAYSRVLSKVEIADRFYAKARRPFLDSSLIFCYPLTEEGKTTVNDISSNRRSGTVVNRGTWHIGGPGWNGSDLDIRDDEMYKGHAVRLAMDELYDCNWTSSYKWKVPVAAACGFYYALLTTSSGASYKIPFVVRNSPITSGSPPKARIAVLCSWSSMVARSKTVFNAALNSGFGVTNACLISNYTGGQPCYAKGMNMPLDQDVFDFQPSGYNDGLAAELYGHFYLRNNGFDFDLITDMDLDAEGYDIISRYQVFMVLGRSSHWSIRMYKAVEKFLNTGGKAIGLSGNTCAWRTSFDENYSVIESRKLNGTLISERVGFVREYTHQNDGKEGGLMRTLGYPAWPIFGIESGSYWDPTDKNVTGWAVTNRYPAKYAKDYQSTVDIMLTGVAPSFGFSKLTGKSCVVACGDVPVSLLPESSRPTVGRPPAVLAICDTTLASISAFSYEGAAVTSAPTVVSAVTYWKRPAGGEVVWFGCNGATIAAHQDPETQKLLGNVWKLFLPNQTATTSSQQIEN